jgi:hypothetical protein
VPSHWHWPFKRWQQRCVAKSRVVGVVLALSRACVSSGVDVERERIAHMMVVRCVIASCLSMLCGRRTLVVANAVLQLAGVHAMLRCACSAPLVTLSFLLLCSRAASCLGRSHSQHIALSSEALLYQLQLWSTVTTATVRTGRLHTCCSSLSAHCRESNSWHFTACRSLVCEVLAFVFRVVVDFVKPHAAPCVQRVWMAQHPSGRTQSDIMMNSIFHQWWLPSVGLCMATGVWPGPLSPLSPVCLSSMLSHFCLLVWLGCRVQGV